MSTDLGFEILDVFKAFLIVTCIGDIGLVAFYALLPVSAVHDVIRKAEVWMLRIFWVWFADTIFLAGARTSGLFLPGEVSLLTLSVLAMFFFFMVVTVAVLILFYGDGEDYSCSP